MAAERVFLGRHAADFHARFVRDFYPHELALWRAGLWRNEWHYGRRGWWWETDGAWYGYPQPVLPYPEEVAVPVVYETPFVEGPDVSQQEGVTGVSSDIAAQSTDDASAVSADPVPGMEAGNAQAAAPGIPPLPPAPVGWYRCYAPSGFYPGLQSCGMPWELVPTAPLPGEL